MARLVADMGQITSSAIIPESGKTVPSLARMIRDARADQQVIKRATQEALRAWFRQSERLNIARREYKLRGPRFVDFARPIGINDQPRPISLSICIAIAPKLSASALKTPPSQPSADRYTAFPTGRLH